MSNNLGSWVFDILILFKKSRLFYKFSKLFYYLTLCGLSNSYSLKIFYFANVNFVLNSY